MRARAGAARVALADPDPWSGFVGFLVALFEKQASDRGLNNAMTMRYPAAAELTAACDRGFAQFAAIVERAQAADLLRRDLAIADLACLIWATSRVIATTVDVAPDAWRRCLDLQLDGLRSSAAHPSSVPPMTEEQVAASMRR